jgi:hypothetical protein
MARQSYFILAIFIALTACSNRTNEIKSNQSSDIAKTELTAKETTGTSTNNKNIITDTLPIHGEIDQNQIEQFYPRITDTIKDRRIFVSERIDIQQTVDIYVSMLHNTGTFDQMFLCTHDKDFKLLNSYYIGKSTMFDKTSHTIEYKKTSEYGIEFHHVDWGYVKKNGEDVIDILKYKKYILVVTKTGKIKKN